MAVIAIMVGGATVAFRAVTHAELRKGAARLGGFARSAYQRAVGKGSTVRMVLDLEKHRVSMLEAPGIATLFAPGKQPEPKDEPEDAKGKDGQRNAWAVAEEALNRTAPVVKVREVETAFEPLSNASGATLKQFQNRALGNKVRFAKVFTPRFPDGVAEGTVALHFFPSGSTEPAVIQLTDGSERVYSLRLHALTGRVEIEGKAIEPEDFGEDRGDLEDSAW